MAYSSIVGDQRVATAVLQDVHQLVRLRRGVDHHERSADFQNGEQAYDSFQGVGRTDGHPISALHLFATYKETITEVKIKYPRLKIIPVTVPLTVRPARWKRVAKMVLGCTDDSAANSKRSKFNALLRCYYEGQPIYDLAQVESTYPDGTRSSFVYGGQTAYSLIGDYTSDGGHLNEVGRRMAARELIRALARTAMTKST